MKQIALDIGLAGGPTLENFFPGPNTFALSHLKLWAASSTRSPVSTYLWGPQGSGKTHLLEAVRGALREMGAECGWMDASQAVWPEFHENWAAVLLDDVHLYGAEQQQRAFNWFVNAQANQLAVLASGLWPVAQLPLREDVRTRLGWGHIFELQLLNEADRRAVLRQRADARGVFLSDEVMDFILRRFSRDLGSLMQLLDQLDGYALQTRRAVTVPLIRSMLESS